eukprot:gene128-306_t
MADVIDVDSQSSQEGLREISPPTEKKSIAESTTSTRYPSNAASPEESPWARATIQAKTKTIELAAELSNRSPLFGKRSCYKLELVNVPWFGHGFDENELRNFFGCFGPVVSAEPDVDMSGVAHVTFKTRWAALSAIQSLDQKIVLDQCEKPLQVKWAVYPKDDKADEDDLLGPLEYSPEEDQMKINNFDFEPESRLWQFTRILNVLETHAKKQNEELLVRQTSAISSDVNASPSSSPSVLPTAPPGQPPPPMSQPPAPVAPGQRTTTAQGVSFSNPYDVVSLPEMTERIPQEPGSILKLVLPAHIAKDVHLQIPQWRIVEQPAQGPSDAPPPPPPGQPHTTPITTFGKDVDNHYAGQRSGIIMGRERPPLHFGFVAFGSMASSTRSNPAMPHVVFCDRYSRWRNYALADCRVVPSCPRKPALEGKSENQPLTQVALSDASRPCTSRPLKDEQLCYSKSMGDWIDQKSGSRSLTSLPVSAHRAPPMLQHWLGGPQHQPASTPSAPGPAASPLGLAMPSPMVGGGPPNVRGDWEELLNDKGNPYYRNRVTNATQWDVPVDFMGPPGGKIDFVLPPSLQQLSVPDSSAAKPFDLSFQGQPKPTSTEERCTRSLARGPGLRTPLHLGAPGVTADDVKLARQIIAASREIEDPGDGEEDAEMATEEPAAAAPESRKRPREEDVDMADDSKKAKVVEEEKTREVHLSEVMNAMAVDTDNILTISSVVEYITANKPELNMAEEEVMGLLENLENEGSLIVNEEVIYLS